MVVLVFTTGCQSSYQTLSDKTILLRAPKRGLLVPYHVLRTNALSADEMINVQVGGQVRHPGTFELTQGATLLEAIAQAGGFAEWAFPRRLVVTQRDGRKFRPKLHQVNDWRTWRSFAWYSETSDWLLDDEAKVEVPMIAAE
jgi:SLBB domain